MSTALAITTLDYIFFSFFSRNQAVRFQNVKAYFLGKTRKAIFWEKQERYLKMLPAEIFTNHAECW